MQYKHDDLNVHDTNRSDSQVHQYYICGKRQLFKGINITETKGVLIVKVSLVARRKVLIVYYCV